MQVERDVDFEYSKKIKKECVEIDRDEHRRTKSLVDKNMKN